MMHLLSSLSPLSLNKSIQPNISWHQCRYYSSKARTRKFSKFHIQYSASSSVSMDSISYTDPEVAHDYSPFLRIYKNGHVERLKGTDIAPPSLDPITQVHSKDVVYSFQDNLSSRLYLPRNANTNKKLPLLVYFHGGGFCIETPYAPMYHNHLNHLVSEANVVAVSVDYRRAPEHPLPIGYDDSWAALKWVASHFNGDGPEEWLNSYADLGKVFVAGDSAGANIAHHMAIRNGEDKLAGINLAGVVLVHPYFWGKEPIGNEHKVPEKRATAEAIWRFACPKTSGVDDPWINPLVDPKLGSLGCNKVLVIVAEKDALRERGWYYCEKLRSSGWEGVVEFMEITEEDHVFHLQKSSCENALAMLKRMAAFINQDN